ncbi:hypothetical protein N5C66_21235 [Rhizobium pusense]|uniref:hypothetical protein n=1 Tax=Agrobacterium pusense TaxID=648995 RepID=UPI000D1A0DB2|nr:hypothetical protein [Agrobacterium pusense]MDH0911774.1 hypothetical protein [Agrobacterium pusense]MDH1097845.1 hypothetical protein [Agrobacterium pusense]MDH1114266.1 hypothetical protein [Agrobacterium pusense]MDH2196356.1 hypothetical protein [Agrobacterium pusense]
MKRFAIIALAALSLASCSATTGSIDTGIRNSLPQVCEAGETAFAVLQPFIAADKPPAALREQRHCNARFNAGGGFQRLPDNHTRCI